MVVVAILLESFGCLCLPFHWLPLATVRSPRGALVLAVLARPPRLWRRGVLLSGAHCVRLRRWHPGACALHPLLSWLWRRLRQLVLVTLAFELFLQVF